MSNGTSGQGPTDPFTKAWTDLFAKMTTPAGQAQSPQQPAWPDETVKQMQRTMFDAMAKQADEYLRSPQFLTMMKQMMDQSIAFKQQIDRFITEAYRGVQAPAQADMQDLAGTLRGIEERLMTRIEELERRLEDAEDSKHGSADKPKAKPAGRSGGKRA